MDKYIIPELLAQHPWMAALVFGGSLIILLMPSRVTMRRLGRRRQVIYVSMLVHYERGPDGWTLHLCGVELVQRALTRTLAWLWRRGQRTFWAALWRGVLKVLERWLR
jgi:hypothetical protein